MLGIKKHNFPKDFNDNFYNYYLLFHNAITVKTCLNNGCIKRISFNNAVDWLKNNYPDNSFYLKLNKNDSKRIN